MVRKTTQIKLLDSYLKGEGFDVILPVNRGTEIAGIRET